MKLALIQYSPYWEDKEGNIEKLNSLINSGNIDADILVFPEMTLTGFTMDSKKMPRKLTESDLIILWIYRLN